MHTFSRYKLHVYLQFAVVRRVSSLPSATLQYSVITARNVAVSMKLM